MPKKNIKLIGEEESEITIPPKKKRSKIWVVLGIIFLSFTFGILGGGLAEKIIIPLILKELKSDKKVEIVEKKENVKVEEQSGIIEAVDKVTPSVVSIVSSKNVYDFWGDVFEKKGGGTGFIITSDGLILTNKHVVSDKNAQYTVITYDGKDYEGKVIASDPVNDLAVIDIEADNLKAVEVGDSDDLKVGQRVIAIGNALGEYQNTVTTGVVSAKGRAIIASDETGQGERLEGVIQTDAAINPGNSGGPLINIQAQVVGINTAVERGGQLIGFALPINIVKPIDKFIKNIREKGRIVRPMLGVRYIPLTKEFASLNNLDVTEGALASEGKTGEAAVIPKSPADKAGIEEGDIMTHINQDKIDENHSLSSLIQKYQPGDEVEITLLRGSTQMKVKATLVEMK
jgi:serine protease Do